METERSLERSIMTKRKIEKLASQYEYSERVHGHFENSGEQFDVFVSHSSVDNEFAEKVLLFLKYAKGGIQGYVDWQDPQMQHPTDAESARRLKDRIRFARKMIFIVTNDSLKSVWCSWELGFADSEKGIENVALLPIKPNNGYWKNNEYLEQYPWIVYEEGMFNVIMPNGVLQPLSDWLVL